MVLLVAVISLVTMFVAFVYRRNLRNQKTSVTYKRVYHKLAMKRLYEHEDTHMYENPLNYKRKGGKLVATSPQLVLMEKTINAQFSNKIPWCLPLIYGDLEMNGAFPSIKMCRLEALCHSMIENVDVFRVEFN